MPQPVCTLAVAMTGLHRKCGGYRRRGEGTPPCGEVTRSAAERADRSVRPYAAIRGVVRDRAGRPQGSKRRGWSWHAVYAYIRIYTIYTRKSLAEFAARRRQKIQIIFHRDMCVGKNTSQAASVEFCRLRQNYARSRLQSPLTDNSVGIFCQ